MDKMFIDVIKRRDAYKLLYTFLMENGMLSTYCRRVREYRLKCGDTNIPTNCKDVLYGVLERYLNSWEETLEFFPARYIGAFRWSDTPEGHRFWSDLNSVESSMFRFLWIEYSKIYIKQHSGIFQKRDNIR